MTIPNTCRGSVPSTCRPDAALVASVGGSVPKMADAVEPLAQEVFKQRRGTSRRSGEERAKV